MSISVRISNTRLLGVLLLLAILLAPLASAAQDAPEPEGQIDVDSPADRPTADLTEEQLVLNDSGVRSLIEGDPAGAVAMLSRSIKLGPSNVAYLNLGRAYQKMGNCDEARDALQKVKTAPVVDNPPPSEVSERADEFLTELASECDFDEQAAEPGSEETPETTSGEPPESEELPNPRLRPEPTPPPEESGSAKKTWGIVTLASGLVIAGGGVGAHFWAVDHRSQIEEATPSDPNEPITDFTQSEAETIQNEANTVDTIGLGMILGGAVLTGVGTYLFVTSESGERQSQLTVSPGRENVTIQWRMTF